MTHILTPQADGLIPAAMRAAASRGRRQPETEHSYRTPFQRDRDRIIHSAHFRRLEYKTQVFVNGEGDNYRTRLTHTLEVTQIARSIARALHLNEDLAEAVALSHDLGHTPFGHAGERLLDELLAGDGGFDHNFQGLRVVDFLERRYAAFVGLNLTYEVREAFVRHAGPTATAVSDEFSTATAPLLEVAATLVADDIAYLAHDIDDGLYSGVVRPEALADQELWHRATNGAGFAMLPASLQRTEGVRRLINLLVTDVLETTRTTLVRLGLDSPDAVRECTDEVVRFSEDVEASKNQLKQFLFANFYRHPSLMAVLAKCQKMLLGLFTAYAENGQAMPAEYGEIAARTGRKRAAADYIAGMTDRFAREEWHRLSGG